jgi:hypothetical protein
MSGWSVLCSPVALWKIVAAVSRRYAPVSALQAANYLPAGLAPADVSAPRPAAKQNGGLGLATCACVGRSQMAETILGRLGDSGESASALFKIKNSI